MTRGTEDTGTFQRIEHRLRDDLQLGDADVDGIMTILHEEIDPADYTLEEWACDRCGENKATAMVGGTGEHWCNNCIFES